jgi:multiple sugar transport system substrate-binding protein
MAGKLTRRGFLRLGSGVAGAAGLGAVLGAVLGACTRQEQERGLVMLSTQLRPAAEAQAFRDGVLSGFDRPVSFVPLDGGPFNDRLAAEAEAGRGSVALVAGQQADFSGLAADGLLEDLSGRFDQLGDVPFNQELLGLARLEGAGLAYIPWVQGTYLMAAHKDALGHLPAGVAPERLTYDQLTAWSRAIFEATGRRALGFPAGEDGLLYRFFQGYAYPSFTGGVNTTFAGQDAVAMWTWLRDTWAYVNRQSLTYGSCRSRCARGRSWSPGTTPPGSRPPWRPSRTPTRPSRRHAAPRAAGSCRWWWAWASPRPPPSRTPPSS